MAMAQLNGCTADELRYGMRTYGGVDRRFDFKIKNDRLVFLSDYAHHPKEIYQSAKSMRELYKDRRITAIFQPHLYTRTRDFYREFAEALSQLDEVILCDIYPAREEPIPGVTSQLIYDHLRPGVEKSMISKDDVLDMVKSRDFDVLVVLGAGDLDNYGPHQISQNKENTTKNHEHQLEENSHHRHLDIVLGSLSGVGHHLVQPTRRDIKGVHQGGHQHCRRDHQRISQRSRNQENPAAQPDLSAREAMKHSSTRAASRTFSRKVPS